MKTKEWSKGKKSVVLAFLLSLWVACIWNSFIFAGTIIRRNSEANTLWNLDIAIITGIILIVAIIYYLHHIFWLEIIKRIDFSY